MIHRVFWLLLPASAAVALVVGFGAGVGWTERKQGLVEDARAQFFEAAQGQFHWPAGSDEWVEMHMPIGGVSFAELGGQWKFRAMYEGAEHHADVVVFMIDTKEKRLQAATHTLPRGVPDDVPVNIAALEKKGLDVRQIKEIIIRIHGAGVAGRVVVAGMVNPRPELVRSER
jgi:hypothetical protein